jgi:hypothetical protein
MDNFAVGSQNESRQSEGSLEQRGMDVAPGSSQHSIYPIMKILSQALKIVILICFLNSEARLFETTFDASWCRPAILLAERMSLPQNTSPAPYRRDLICDPG